MEIPPANVRSVWSSRINLAIDSKKNNVNAFHGNEWIK